MNYIVLDCLCIVSCIDFVLCLVLSLYCVFILYFVLCLVLSLYCVFILYFVLSLVLSPPPRGSRVVVTNGTLYCIVFSLYFVFVLCIQLSLYCILYCLLHPEAAEYL